MENHLVILAGSNGLIGKSILDKLIYKDSVDLICLDLYAKNLENKFKNLKNKKIEFVNVDFIEYEKIKKVIDSLDTSNYSKISAINSVYIKPKSFGKVLEDLKPNEISHHIECLLTSSIYFLKVFVEKIQSFQKGHLINFSSIQGLNAPKFSHYQGTGMHSPIEYSACKAAIINYTKWSAKYYKDLNIRFNCICPGGVLENQPLQFQEKYKQDCTSKGLLDPDDISNLVTFLLSNEASTINGQAIVIDDGWSL